MKELKNPSYAGIGSRKTPPNALKIFYQLGATLAEKGFILRSGHAAGADQSFEDGCDSSNGKKEIYLPWKGFNNSYSDLYDISVEAYNLANNFHPAFRQQSIGVQKLLARDGYQVLGLNLNDPCKMIICYTEFGKLKGGTSQAIRIAKAYNIPVFNLGEYSDTDKFINDVLSYSEFILSHKNPLEFYDMSK